MKMVTEWYRAFRYQVCPRSRFLEFHLNGVGIERREQSAAQVASNIVRHYLGTVLSGEFIPMAAGDIAYADFMNEGRRRGFTGTKNDFNEAKQIAEKIKRVVSEFTLDPNFTVVHANKELSVQLTEDIRFFSTPVAVVSNSTGVFYLYFVKVTSAWRKDRQEAMARDNQLLSEMFVAHSLCSGEFGGAIVQVISLSKSQYETPFVVSWDEAATRDWHGEVKYQEMLAKVHVEDFRRIGQAELLERDFRKHRHSCDFPYPCQFKGICWGDLQNEPHPENDPRYMPREIKLVSEKELVESWQK